MKKIDFCIAAFAAFAFGAFAETVVRPAGDGANTITYEVAPDGTIESAVMTCVHVPDKIEDAQPEKVTVYRLQLYKNADGSDAAYVVGVDGVERPVVLVDPAEYKLLTERLDAVWQSFHATADGRRKLHGKIERTEIDEAKREKVEVHADGYRHVETLPQKRSGVAATMKVGGAKPGNISDRQWQMRQRLSVMKKKPAREVTVEHDAVTGVDTMNGGAR